jgi:hypothetical protein
LNYFAKILKSTGESAAKSLLSSGIKKTVKDLFNSQMKKSQGTIESEMINSIGFVTQHFKLDKAQNIVYKPSQLLMHEWIVNSPKINGKILRDEENNSFFFDGKPITNSVKVELLNLFSKDTGITSPSMPGWFDSALKLLDPVDYTSLLFKKEIPKWNVNNVSVIDSWLSNVFGTAIESDPAYANFLFKKWIVGTAKRIIQPGSSLDGCLTLQGPANVGKTRFFREILPEPFTNRTGEIYCNIKNPQKFIESIIGKTVACFDELSILENKRSEETFKQLLSSQFIDVRLVWRKDPQRYMLRQGFAATSNKNKFINDQFLSRRLWTIKLNNSSRINLDFVRANRKMLWSEAVFLAETGPDQFLSVEEQKKVEESNLEFMI